MQQSRPHTDRLCKTITVRRDRFACLYWHLSYAVASSKTIKRESNARSIRFRICSW